MPVNITVTNAGRAAIVNAQHNGTAPVTIAQVGLSQTAVTPVATATALTGEFKRISALSGEVVAADTIHLTMSDDSADAYTLRSFALYLADGTLFALFGQADPVINKAASSIGAISIDVIFADISAAALTFGNANFTNPPATTERQGVVELSTVAEAQAGIDALRALSPATAKAAILGWLLAQDGSGSGLDADMLDGQDGSYYTNIIAHLGYSPVNKAGDTMTGALGLPGDPSSALQAAPKQYVDALVTASALLAKLVTVDGSGSGLDADLLDGQDSAYFTNIIARMGFTPVNRAGDTMTGALALPGNPASALQAAPKQYVDGLVTAAALLAKLVTVDGSGSGLDADLLDGQDSSFFTNIIARLGYTPANRSGDTFTGQVNILAAAMAMAARRSGATDGYSPVFAMSQDALTNGMTELFFMQLAANVFGLEVRNASNAKGTLTLQPFGGTVLIGSGTAWHAANDGAGSGLDADLLDGLNGSDFAKMADFARSLSSTGYQKLPNGLILQWGDGAHSNGTGAQAVTFPTSFPNAALFGMASNAASGPPSAFHGTSPPNTTGMTVYSSTSSGVAAAAGTSFRWLAIGY